MPNVTKTANNRRNSKFLAIRRKSFFIKRTAKTGFNFLKIHKGKVTRCNTVWGCVKATFESKITGRTAFAYGQDFLQAYQNMMRKFNIKYAV